MSYDVWFLILKLEWTSCIACKQVVFVLISREWMHPKKGNQREQRILNIQIICCYYPNLILYVIGRSTWAHPSSTNDYDQVQSCTRPTAGKHSYYEFMFTMALSCLHHRIFNIFLCLPATCHSSFSSKMFYKPPYNVLFRT